MHGGRYIDPDDLYLAGDHVPAGRYQQIGRGRRVVELPEDGILPASLDGRVACYTRILNAWSSLRESGKMSRDR